MRLCLVEDLAVAGLEPLTLTRPAHELLLGATSLGQKIATAFGVGPGPGRRGCVVRNHLVSVLRERDPRLAVNDREWLTQGAAVVVNGRWVPPLGFQTSTTHSRPWVGLCDGLPACAMVGPEAAGRLEPHGIDDWFDEMLAEHGGRELGGEWIQHPWDLVAKNGAHLERDFVALTRNGPSTMIPANLALVGPPDRLRIDETERVDP